MLSQSEEKRGKTLEKRDGPVRRSSLLLNMFIGRASIQLERRILSAIQSFQPLEAEDSPRSEHASLSFLLSVFSPLPCTDWTSFQIDEQTAMNYETRNLAGLPRNLKTDRRFSWPAFRSSEVDHFDHERSFDFER